MKRHRHPLTAQDIGALLCLVAWIACLWLLAFMLDRG